MKKFLRVMFAFFVPALFLTLSGANFYYGKDDTVSVFIGFYSLYWGLKTSFQLYRNRDNLLNDKPWDK